MSKIVELKAGEIANVVGGVDSIAVSSFKPFATQTSTLNLQTQPMPTSWQNSTTLLALRRY
jgi:hypothetical protein